MYRKEDVLHRKYTLCMRFHRYRLYGDTETKKGYRIIQYICFLNNEYCILKRFKNGKNNDKKRLYYDIIDTMNLACNRYLSLVGEI